MSSERDTLDYSGDIHDETKVGVIADRELLNDDPTSKKPAISPTSSPDLLAEPEPVDIHDSDGELQPEVELQPAHLRKASSSEDYDDIQMKGRKKKPSKKHIHGDAEIGYSVLPANQSLEQLDDVLPGQEPPSESRKMLFRVLLGGVTLCVLLALTIISGNLAFRQPGLTMTILFCSSAFGGIISILFIVWATCSKNSNTLGTFLTFASQLLAGFALVEASWILLYREVHFTYLIGLRTNSQEWSDMFEGSFEDVLKSSNSLMWWAIGLLVVAALLFAIISNISFDTKYNTTPFSLFWSTMWMTSSAWFVIYWITQTTRDIKLFQNTQELKDIVWWLNILAGVGVFFPLLTVFANLLKVRACQTLLTVLLAFVLIGLGMYTATLHREILNLQEGQEKYPGVSSTCVFTMQAVHEADFLTDLCPIGGGKYLPTGQVASKVFMTTRWENNDFEEYRSLNPACCLTSKFIQQWPFMQVAFWSVALCVATFVAFQFNRKLIKEQPSAEPASKPAEKCGPFTVLFLLLWSLTWCSYLYLHEDGDQGTNDVYSQLQAFMGPRSSWLDKLTTVPRRLIDEYSTRLSTTNYNGTVCFDYDVDNMPFPSFVAGSPHCGDEQSCYIRIVIALTNGSFKEGDASSGGDSFSLVDFFPNCYLDDFQDIKMVYGKETKIKDYLRSLKICLKDLKSTPTLSFYKDQAKISDMKSDLNTGEDLSNSTANSSHVCLEGFTREYLTCKDNSTCKYSSLLDNIIVRKTLKGRFYHVEDGQKSYQTNANLTVFATFVGALISNSYVLLENGYFAIKNVPVLRNDSYVLKLRITDYSKVFLDKSVEVKISPSKNKFIGTDEIRLITKNGNLCTPGSGDCENRPHLTGTIKFTALSGSFKSIASKSMERLGEVNVFIYRNFTREDEDNHPFPASSDKNGVFELSNLQYGSYTIYASKNGYKSLVKYVNLQSQLHDLGKIVLDLEGEEKDATIAAGFPSNRWEYDLYLKFKTSEGTTCTVSPYSKFCGYAVHSNDATSASGEERIYIRKLAVATYVAYYRVALPYNATCKTCDEVLGIDSNGLDWNRGNVEPPTSYQEPYVQSLFYRSGGSHPKGSELSSLGIREDDNFEEGLRNTTVINYLGVPLNESQRFKVDGFLENSDQAISDKLIENLEDSFYANNGRCIPYLLYCSSNINCTNPPRNSENCSETVEEIKINTSNASGVGSSKTTKEQTYYLHSDHLVYVVNSTVDTRRSEDTLEHLNSVVSTINESRIYSVQTNSSYTNNESNGAINTSAWIVNNTTDLGLGVKSDFTWTNFSYFVPSSTVEGLVTSLASITWYNSTVWNSTDTNLKLQYNTTSGEGLPFLRNSSRTNSTLNGTIREYEFNISSNNSKSNNMTSEFLSERNVTDSNNTVNSSKIYSINFTLRVIEDTNSVEPIAQEFTSRNTDLMYANLTTVQFVLIDFSETYVNRTQTKQYLNSALITYSENNQSMQSVSRDELINVPTDYQITTVDQTWQTQKTGNEPLRNSSVVTTYTTGKNNGLSTANSTTVVTEYDPDLGATVAKSTIRLENNVEVTDIDKTERRYNNGTTHVVESRKVTFKKDGSITLGENQKIVSTIESWLKGDKLVNSTENLLNTTFYPGNRSLVLLLNATFTTNDLNIDSFSISVPQTQLEVSTLYSQITNLNNITIAKPTGLKNTKAIQLTLQDISGTNDEAITYMQAFPDNLTTLADKSDEYYQEIAIHGVQVIKTSYTTVAASAEDAISQTSVDNHTTTMFNPPGAAGVNSTVVRSTYTNTSSSSIGYYNTTRNSIVELYVNFTEQNANSTSNLSTTNTSMIRNKQCSSVNSGPEEVTEASCVQNGSILFSSKDSLWHIDYLNETSSKPNSQLWVNKTNSTHNNGFVNMSMVGSKAGIDGLKSSNFSQWNYTTSKLNSGGLYVNETKGEYFNNSLDFFSKAVNSWVKKEYNVIGKDNKNIEELDMKLLNNSVLTDTGVPTNVTTTLNYSIKNVANLRENDANLQYFNQTPVELNSTQTPLENCSINIDYHIVKQSTKKSADLFGYNFREYKIHNEFEWNNHTNSINDGDKVNNTLGCTVHTVSQNLSNYSKEARFDTTFKKPVYVTTFWTAAVLNQDLSKTATPSTHYSESVLETTRIEKIDPSEYMNSPATVLENLPNLRGHDAKITYREQQWEYNNHTFGNGSITRISSYTANTTITNDTRSKYGSYIAASKIPAKQQANEETKDAPNNPSSPPAEGSQDPITSSDSYESTLSEPVPFNKSSPTIVFVHPAAINESNITNYTLNESGFESETVNFTYIDTTETPTCKNCTTEYVFRNVSEHSTNQSLKNPEKYNGTTKQYTSLVDEMRWRGHPRVEGVVYEKNVGEYLLMNYPSNSTTDETTNTSYIMIIEGNITNGTVQLVENTSKEVEPRFVGAVYRNEKPTASRQSVDDLEDLDVLTNVSNYTRNIRYSGEESKRLKYFLTNKGSLRVQRANSTSNFNQTVYEFYEFDYIDENPKNFIKSCIVENTSVEYPVLEFNTTLLTYTYTNSCQQNPKTASMPGNGSKLEYADKTEYTLKYFYNCTWNEKPLVLHQKTSRTLVVTSADGKQSFTNLAKPELIDKDVTPDVEENCEADQAAP